MELIFQKIKFSRTILSLFAFICLLIFQTHANACGWAGDGESDDDDETVWVGVDGKPVEEGANPIDNPRFQTRIGNSHRKAKDHTEAVRWYRMAASQGFEAAQNNLAAMYEQGLGIARSDVLAVQWYRLAARQGNAKAQHSIGQMYLEGRGVAQDIQLASKWIEKSAENGHVSAINKIASMYWEGKGVIKDDIRAYTWWKLGAMHGESSDKSLVTAKSKMTSEAIARAEQSFALSNIPQKKQTILNLYLTAKAGYEKWENSPDNIIIIDTRTLGEYIFVGHGAMAYNIPIKFLQPNPDSAPVMVLNKNFVSDVKIKFKETDTILVICRSGMRSVMAVNMLARAGFKRVYSIIDGFEGDKLKNPDSPDNGKRVINGWKNSNAPWTYELNQEQMYRP